MNYFGQVVFEILQKITSWKAILETKKEIILSDFLKFLKGET